MPRPSVSDWLGLLALALMWGTAFGFTRIAVETVPPASVVCGRVVVAGVLLTVLARALGLELPRGLLWVRLLVLAAAGNALPFFLIAWGQQRVDSALAGILMASMPLATLLLAHFFIPGEVLSSRKLVGFALGLLGVIVLIGPDALRGLGSGSTQAQLAILAGALSYAVNAILSRRLPEMHPVVSSAGVMLMASVLLLPLAAWFDGPALLQGSGASSAAILVLGVVATAAGTVTYFRLIVAAGPTFVSGTNYLIPLVAVGMGVLLLGEHPSWRAFAALAMILAGLALSQIRSSSPVTESRSR